MSGPEQGAVCSTASRIPKHVALQAQIRHVSNVADELQQLIDKARGEKPAGLLNTQSDAKVTEIRPEASLSDVLNSGADELQEQCNRMRDQIRTLEDLLF